MNGPMRVYARDELEAFMIITKWIKAGKPETKTAWWVPKGEQE